MPKGSSPAEVASSLLALKGFELQSIDLLQSLWAGYGQICRMRATVNNDAESHSRADEVSEQTFILKLITPPPGQEDNEGHIRKLLSYEVEHYFYTRLAPQLPPSLPIAESLISLNEKHASSRHMAIILSDLKQRYPVAGEKRDVLNATQVYAALDWLSGFHGFWWSSINDLEQQSAVLPPLEETTLRPSRDSSTRTVWLNGGYTYLATRRTEYRSLEDDDSSEWSHILTSQNEHGVSISELVATVLAPSSSRWTSAKNFITLIHGDVKSENLFTSENGEEVAFYDFQYTGFGLGVCDLAKLFTCSVPLHLLVGDASIPRKLAMQDGERHLLKRYLRRIEKESGKTYEWHIFVHHWHSALVDWLRFQASWGFWGNTQWLEARVRSILNDAAWAAALKREAMPSGI